MTNHTNNPVETVCVSVNSRRLVGALKDAFTSHANVLAELLQNARRAGSPRVDVTFDEATKTLTVSDQGCGIADWKTLFKVAESGWDEETTERENPFGIGAASTWHACEEMEIISRGKRLIAKTADLLAFKPAELVPCDAAPGSTFVLRGLRFEVSVSMIERLARGFPIPVVFNGKDLPRPDALTSGTFHSSPVGRVRLGPAPGVAHRLYLQGLPLHDHSSYYTYYRDRDASVVHLDSRQFRARVPDRDVLVGDYTEARGTIEQAISELWISALEADLNIGRHDRVEQAVPFLSSAGRRDLLNRLPFLPGSVCSTASMALLLTEAVREHAGQEDSTGVRLHRTDAATARLVKASAVAYSDDYSPGDLDSIEEASGVLNAASYAIAAKCLLVDTTALDPDHWVFSLPSMREDLAVTRVRAVAPVPGVLETLPCQNFAGVVQVCDKVTMEGPFGKVTTEDLPAVAKGKGPLKVLVPANMDSTALCGLYDDYMYEDDFQDTNLDTDSDKVALQLSVKRSGNVTSVLARLLEPASWDGSTHFLAGKSFTVSFNQKGKATVELA